MRARKLLIMGMLTMLVSLTLAYPVNSDPWCENCCMVRGDDNEDGIVSFVDYYYAQQFAAINSGWFPSLQCEEQADLDGSGTLDIGDFVFIIDYLFGNHDYEDTLVACP